jgi:zinc protease
MEPNVFQNQLVDYLQSIGVKFGQHLNAYTSFDETFFFYQFHLMILKIRKSFQIIEDWAFILFWHQKKLIKKEA